MLEALNIADDEDVGHLMELLDQDGDGDISLAEMLEGMLDLRGVSDDGNRTALLHVIRNRDHKFEVIERALATIHAPTIVERLLQSIEVSLSDFGMVPVPEFAEEVKAKKAKKA